VRKSNRRAVNSGSLITVVEGEPRTNNASAVIQSVLSSVISVGVFVTAILLTRAINDAQ